MRAICYVRIMKSHPLFSLSFRPFFLLCALQAIIIPILWVANLSGKLNFNGALLPALQWHSHEMIFGYTLAVVAGFLLTASANWAGKKPFSGPTLMLLVFFWLLDRLSLFLPSKEFALIFTLPFILYFLFLTWQMLKSNPKNRNFFIPTLLLFFVAKSMMTFGAYFNRFDVVTLGKDLGIQLILLIIVYFAGSVFPFFAAKRLPHLNIKVPPIITKLALISCVLLLLPKSLITTELYSALCFLALIFNTIQFLSWKPFRSFSQPLIIILYFGFFWILSYLLFNSLTAFSLFSHLDQPSLHLLTMGGLGGVSLAMMCRITLGNTGHKLIMSRSTFLIFLFLNSSIFFRVLIPTFIENTYSISLYGSLLLWLSAFSIFIFEYAPKLYKKKPL